MLSDIAKPISVSVNPNGSIYDLYNKRECDSSGTNCNTATLASMMSAAKGQSTSVGNPYKYASLVQNTIAPFLSRGSYLHYIPKNQVKDAYIAREVYTSGYTAYTIERNAMSTLYNNNSGINNNINNNSTNNNFVNHLHTICIATPPPKVSFTSTHCL